MPQKLQIAFIKNAAKYPRAMMMGRLKKTIGKRIGTAIENKIIKDKINASLREAPASNVNVVKTHLGNFTSPVKPTPTGVLAGVEAAAAKPPIVGVKTSIGPTVKNKYVGAVDDLAGQKPLHVLDRFNTKPIKEVPEKTPMSLKKKLLRGAGVTAVVGGGTLASYTPDSAPVTTTPTTNVSTTTAAQPSAPTAAQPSAPTAAQPSAPTTNVGTTLPSASRSAAPATNVSRTPPSTLADFSSAYTPKTLDMLYAYYKANGEDISKLKPIIDAFNIPSILKSDIYDNLLFKLKEDQKPKGAKQASVVVDKIIGRVK